MDWEIYFSVLAFVCGICAGSFINCAADRYVPSDICYVKRESILSGRSHCPVCGTTLTTLDLIPVLSYIFLGGKCRHCGARIPLKCLFTEVLGGIIFLSAVSFFGVSFRALESLILFAILYAVALIDHNTFEIPDGLLKAAVMVFALFLPTYPNMTERLTYGLIGMVALGGGLLVVALIMDRILKRDSLGGGDVKLFGVLGLFLGPWSGLLALILSCVFGLLFAFTYGKKGKEFPFGPSIALAAWIALLFGQNIIDMYLSLFM